MTKLAWGGHPGPSTHCVAPPVPWRRALDTGWGGLSSPPAIGALLLALAITPAFAAEAVAAWTMEQYDGELVRDETGHGHDAVVKSKSGEKPQLVPGVKGNCLELHAGDEAFLQVADAPELDPTDGFAAMAWIKPKARGKAYSILCKRGDPNSKDRPGPGWRFRYFWARVMLDMGDNEQRLSATSAEWSTPPGFWSHVAVTFDGKQTVRFYVNAVLESEHEIAGTFVPLKRPLIIGNYIGRKNAYAFDGLLDDVKLFRGVLSEEEVFAEAKL